MFKKNVQGKRTTENNLQFCKDNKKKSNNLDITDLSF